MTAQTNLTFKKFSKLFLLAFTRELIINSKTKEIIELERILKEKHEIETEKKDIIHGGKSFFPKQEQIYKKTGSFTKPAGINQRSRVLTIPEPKFPPNLQYLKPIPTENQIDLGKLNQLIKDPFVKIVECNGPNEKIIVSTPSKKLTNISLSKEEINEIIKKFSESAKIPVQEGVFKVAFGKLIFSAIISDVVGSKFIIRKMPPKMSKANAVQNIQTFPKNLFP